MAKPEKENKVALIKEQMKESTSVFVTEYTGLNVSDITELRKNLRENSVRYLVAKNTLIRIAAKETGNEGLVDYLQGQTAIAFSKDDPAVAAKILYESFKKIEKPEIKAFVLEDVVYPGADIKKLADLPPKEVLLSMVVSAVESPLTEVVSSLEAVFQEFVATVDALAQSKA